jgi:hypothetical protein
MRGNKLPRKKWIIYAVAVAVLLMWMFGESIYLSVFGQSPN